MAHRKRIIENMFALGFVQAINYILPLLVLPYLARVLGAENFGVYILAQALAFYFVVLTDYGFKFTATQIIALHRDDPEKSSKIFSSVIQIKLFLLLASFLTRSAKIINSNLNGDLLCHRKTFG
jgi:PST family polysaccharide transporter